MALAARHASTGELQVTCSRHDTIQNPADEYEAWTQIRQDFESGCGSDIPCLAHAFLAATERRVAGEAVCPIAAVRTERVT